MNDKPCTYTSFEFKQAEDPRHTALDSLALVCITQACMKQTPKKTKVSVPKLVLNSVLEKTENNEPKLSRSK